MDGGNYFGSDVLCLFLLRLRKVLTLPLCAGIIAENDAFFTRLNFFFCFPLRGFLCVFAPLR
jgi:hypothetical protein